MKQLLHLHNHLTAKFHYFKGFSMANTYKKWFLTLQICFDEMTEFENSI